MYLIVSYVPISRRCPPYKPCPVRRFFMVKVIHFLPSGLFACQALGLCKDSGDELDCNRHCINKVELNFHFKDFQLIRRKSPTTSFTKFRNLKRFVTLYNIKKSSLITKGRNVIVPTELFTNFSKETHHFMLSICI